MRRARTTCRAALLVMTLFTRLGVVVMPKPESTRGRTITANAFPANQPHEKETRPRYNDLPLQASVVNSPTNWKDLGRGLTVCIIYP